MSARNGSPNGSAHGTALLGVLPATLAGEAQQPLFPEDVEKLLPTFPDGACRFSRAWVLEHVAPNKRRKMGRWVYWLRGEFEAWHGRWLRNELTADEIATPRRRGRRRG